MVKTFEVDTVSDFDEEIFNEDIILSRKAFRKESFDWSKASLLLNDERTSFKVFHYLIEAMFARGEIIISLEAILEKLETFVKVADGNSVAVFVNMLLQPAQEEIVTQEYLEKLYNFYHDNKIDNGLKADAIWRSFLFHPKFGEVLSSRLWEEHSDSYLFFMTSMLKEHSWFFDSNDLSKAPEFAIVEMYMHDEVLKTFVLEWGDNNPVAWHPLARKIAKKLYPDQDIDNLPQEWVLSLIET